MIRGIIRDLCEKKGVATLDEILNLGDQLNIQGYQVEEVISRMLTSGELYEARTNEYRFTR